MKTGRCRRANRDQAAARRRAQDSLRRRSTDAPPERISINTSPHNAATSDRLNVQAPINDRGDESGDDAACLPGIWPAAVKVSSGGAALPRLPSHPLSPFLVVPATSEGDPRYPSYRESPHRVQPDVWDAEGRGETGFWRFPRHSHSHVHNRHITLEA